MGMITKTVTGDAEDLKLVSNSKNAPLDPKGGTLYATYKGSAPPRPAGPANNVRGRSWMPTVAPGYVDQGPVESAIGKSKKIASEFLVKGTGPTATTVKAKYTADNDQPIEKGMGGPVYGPLVSKWGDM